MFTQPVSSSAAGILSPSNPVSSSATAAPNPSGRTSRSRALGYLRSFSSRDSILRNGHQTPTSRLAAPSRSTTHATAGRRHWARLSNANDLSVDLAAAITRSSSGGSSNANSAVPASPRHHNSAPSLPPFSRPPLEPAPAVDSTSTDASSDPSIDSDPEHASTARPAATARASAGAAESSDAPATTMWPRTRAATTGDMSLDMLPTIRFSAHYDPRSNRPSLSFTPISRTLPTGSEAIKVGRYSERENHAAVPANTPSAAPVGFKSKVVSRRHCEFFFDKGKWYIKDVKSSSGTFLNHIRLSPPGTESKPYMINDGDIVQLGIDFRGGEEMIFRCVKMRIELNRGWQSKPNTFNVNTHKRLRNLTAAATANASSHAQDCSICLNAIAPCQSLFVAPCSHTWHFKCIREMVAGPGYPNFICPNCRAAADLDADVEEPDDAEEWEHFDSGAEDILEEPDTQGTPQGSSDDPFVTPTSSGEASERPAHATTTTSGDATVLMDGADVEEHSPSVHTTSTPVSIVASTPRATNSTRSRSQGGARTPSPVDGPHEGPLTPRNDAGPFVFDGDAGRASREMARQAMDSLDAATNRLEIN